MQTLYATTALALMFGLTTTVYGAGTETETPSGAQQTAQSQQQPKQQQTGQQSAQQQAAQGQQRQKLGSIDANNDGRISAEEAQAHRQRAFSSLDADSDSKLSRDETAGLAAIEPGYVVVTRMVPVAVTTDVGDQMLSQMDQDQNQQISRQEYMQYGEQQFKQAQERAGGELRTGGQSGQQTQSAQQTQSGQQTGDVVRWREAGIDRNGDSIVSADEAAAAWVETFQQLDRNADDQLSQDELGQMQAQKAMIDRRFAKLDGNGDGQISLDEYSNAGHNLMQFADLNQDGEVTAWEYRAVRVTDR